MEEYKQQFEERLGAQAGEVGRGLDRVKQLVSELEELSDAAMVGKYIKVSASAIVGKCI